MRLYLRFILNILFIAGSYGLIGPFLVSQKDDFSLFLGIFYCAIIAPSIIILANRSFIKRTYQQLTGDVNENS